MFSLCHQPVNGLALEGTPFGGGHNLSYLLDGLAVGGKHALGAGVHGHGHIVGVGDGYSYDWDHAAGVHHNQKVAQLTAAAVVVLGIDDHVIQAHTIQDGYPLGVPGDGDHGAEHPPTGLQYCFKFCSVHVPSPY